MNTIRVNVTGNNLAVLKCLLAFATCDHLETKANLAEYAAVNPKQGEPLVAPEPPTMEMIAEEAIRRSVAERLERATKHPGSRTVVACFRREQQTIVTTLNISVSAKLAAALGAMLEVAVMEPVVFGPDPTMDDVVGVSIGHGLALLLREAANGLRYEKNGGGGGLYVATTRHIDLSGALIPGDPIPSCELSY